MLLAVGLSRRKRGLPYCTFQFPEDAQLETCSFYKDERRCVGFWMEIVIRDLKELQL
jgi:hypothetical protein